MVSLLTGRQPREIIKSEKVSATLTVSKACSSYVVRGLDGQAIRGRFSSTTTSDIWPRANR